MGVDDGRIGDALPIGREFGPPDVGRVVGAEEEGALAVADPASHAEGHADRGDGGREPHLRQDGVGAVLVRALGRRGRCGAGLAGSPPVVRALRDEVQLVVARGTVLRLPQVPRERVEVEALGVSDPVDPDPAPRDGVVRRDAPEAVIRRILPASLVRSYALPGSWASPWIAYRRRSGPNRILPPS